MNTLIENLGFELIPYNENCVDSPIQCISLSLSQQELSVLVGKTANKLENQGPLFRAKVPKQFLLKKHDNPNIYLSAMKGVNGGIVGQPGFEEVNPFVLSIEVIENIAYDISNQMTAKCLSWMNEQLAILKSVQDYYDRCLIQFQNCVEAHEYKTYLIKLKSITEEIDALEEKQDFIFKRAARKSIYCNTFAMRKSELSEIFNFFLSELQMQLITDNGNPFNFNDPAEMKLIHNFSVLGNVVKYLFIIFSWEILLTDAQHDRDDLSEYTKIFKILFGNKFLKMYEEVSKNFNDKKDKIEKYLEPFYQKERQIANLLEQNKNLQSDSEILYKDIQEINNNLLSMNPYSSWPISSNQQQIYNIQQDLFNKQQAINNNIRLINNNNCEIQQLSNDINLNQNQIQFCKARLQEIDDFLEKASIDPYNKVLGCIEEKFPEFSEFLLNNVLLISSKEEDN